MESTSQYYQDLTNKIIRKSFPILKGKRIFVWKIWMFDSFSGGAFHPLPVLFINKNKFFLKDELIALIVHELCHLEIFYKRSFFKNIKIEIAYWLFGKIRRHEEVETDKLLIKKGYAKGIYKLAKKKVNKKISKYYMSPEEIKSYAKKINKWR